MKQEPFTFQDSRSTAWTGMLSSPDVPTEKVVILGHGFISHQHSRTNRRLTDHLVSQKIATLRFNWDGMGDSPSRFADITVGKCCHQLEEAIAALQASHYARIGVIGSSFGGLITTLEKIGHRTINLLEKPGTDLLYDGRFFRMYAGEFIDTPHTHGTGCTYASAIAAHLAKGKSIPDAIEAAKTYISQAIRRRKTSSLYQGYRTRRTSSCSWRSPSSVSGGFVSVMSGFTNVL